jgi:YfiH family protein
VGARLVGLRQLHGAGVVVEPADGETGDLAGDALVSTRPGRVLLVRTADCAAVALGSPEGVYGAVHAGWRGLVGEVVERAVEAMRSLGATEVVAGFGPCIGPCCYAFGHEALDVLARRYGEQARRRSRTGEIALDLPAVVRGALASAGASVVHDGAVCTGCTADTWSHRVRGDSERQALAVWRDLAP